VLLLCSISAASVEARLFDRLRHRRGGGGGDGNVTSNAPEAPADLQPEPDRWNPSVTATDYNTQAYDNNGMPDVSCYNHIYRNPPSQVPVAPMPQQVAQVPQQVAQAVPIPSAYTSVVRSVPVVDTVSVATNSAPALVADPRIDAIISAVEQRLGIKGQAALEGDPAGLIKQLPKLMIELQSQDGEPIAQATIDFRAYVLEKLSE